MKTMTAREWLDAVEALADAATMGPWHAVGDALAYETDSCNCGPGGENGLHERGCGLDLLAEMSEADAKFIAAARTAVPALVAALRAVLDLHTRATGYSNGDDFECCGTCFDLDEQPEPWPCPTVAAITAHLPATPTTEEDR